MRRMLGILGGMGPESTAAFLQKLLAQTPAERDQDHIPTLVCSLPQTPDRTASILGGRDDVWPWLAAGVKFLAAGGAGLVVVPCVSAHYHFRELVALEAVPLLSIVDATCEAVAARTPPPGPVAVLGTTLTQRTGLLARPLRAAGYSVIEPEEDLQDRAVMAAIHAVKAGRIDEGRERLAPAVEAAIDVGATVLVAGCTELPLLLGRRASVPVVDCLDALARSVVVEMTGAGKPRSGRKEGP
jgi:aspartate racemase